MTDQSVSQIQRSVAMETVKYSVMVGIVMVLVFMVIGVSGLGW